MSCRGSRRRGKPSARAARLTAPCRQQQAHAQPRAAFTLTELLVTVGVIVLLVFLFTQLLNSAATIMTLGNKRMDADSQARQVLDRMAIDFAQMVKRSDVDYYLKIICRRTPSAQCPATWK